MIKILCYNIHGGYDVRGRRDLTRLNALLDDYDIDIAVFQEFETRPSRKASQEDVSITAGPERPHRIKGLTKYEGEDWFGNLMLSRYPFVEKKVHDLETRPSYEPRKAIDAVIDTPIGNVRIIGTHLSLSPIERYSEVRKLIALMDKVETTEKGPLLLMGDLNEWRPKTKLISFLDSRMTQIPVGRTFPSFCPVFALDRVWYDNMPSDKITAKRIDTAPAKYLSDHLPLYIEVYA